MPGLGGEIQTGAETAIPATLAHDGAAHKSNKSGAKEENNDNSHVLNFDVAAIFVNSFHLEISFAGFGPVDFYALYSLRKLSSLSSPHGM
jgi:hypothetical protein